MMLMMRTVRVLSMMLAALFSTSTFADSWNCRQDDLVREVVIEYPHGGPLPCRVIYRKKTEGAEDKELWSAVNQQGYCTERAQAFTEKLQGWGWACEQTGIGQETTQQPAP